MDKRSKVFILVLGAICVVLGFIAFQTTQTYNSEKKRLEAETQKLNQDNADLNNNLNRAKEETKNTYKKLESMQKDLSVVSQERDNWKDKYGQAIEEKDELSAKITELQQAKQAAAESAKPPVPEDSYWASIVKDRAALEVSVSDLNKQLETMNIRIDELTKDNNELTTELNKINQLKAGLERQSGYGEKLSQALSEELVREKNDKRALLEQMAKLQDDYSVLQQQLRDASDEKIMLAKQQQALKEENKLLARKISETDQVLQDRMTEMLNMKQQLTNIRSDITKDETPGAGARVVELPAIVVKAEPDNESATVARGNLSGNILAVNKENNFVVIDIGESLGVQKGMAFDIYRGNSKVGSVEVIQVRRDITAADIKSQEPGQQIKVGDIAR